MFVGRRLDTSIYGMWTSKQPIDADHLGMEELPDNHPDVIAFQNRIMPVSVDPLVAMQAKIDDLETRMTSVEVTK